LSIAPFVAINLVACFATKESKSIVKLLLVGKHQVSTSQFVRNLTKNFFTICEETLQNFRHKTW
jgi:hypothetical protein